MSLLDIDRAALAAAKRLQAAQPRADIGNILGTVGTAVGTIFGGPVGAAVGGAAGSLLGDAFGGGGSGGSSAGSSLTNGLSEAEIAALGQQAATGDANEVSKLVNSAQTAIGDNTSASMQKFLQLLDAFGASPALGTTPATLGAAPTVQGIGTSAKVAPAGGAAAAPGSLSGGVNAPTNPTSSGNVGAALTASGGAPATSSSSGLTPQQTAVLQGLVNNTLVPASENGGVTPSEAAQMIQSGLQQSGLFTPSAISGIVNQWNLSNNPAGGVLTDKGGGNTAAEERDWTNELAAGYPAGATAPAATTTATSAPAAATAPTALAPVTAPGAAPKPISTQPVALQAPISIRRV